MQIIETPHFLIRNGRVRPRFPGGRISNELAGHIAAELVPAEVSAPALAQLRRVARRRVVIAVPLEAAPDPVFGHVQAFDLPGLARMGAAAQALGWSQAVYAADGGWLVLDRRERWM